MPDKRLLVGRRSIFTNATTIDRKNVIQVLKDALDIHAQNQSDIDYLFRYWKGEQPIRNRTKTIRPEINNKIVVNRANEIVAFKVGYVFGEPIQYVSRKEETTKGVSALNDIMFSTDKEAIDKELAEWFSICGIAYRMVLPNKKITKDNPSPICVYVLDPRFSFVVHSFALGEPVVMGVKFVTLDKDKILYSVYTENRYYEILEGKIIKEEAHSLGFIPIIEYYTSKAKIGEFEKVIDMLDAINLTISDRVNGIEQFVQSLTTITTILGLVIGAIIGIFL
jgi:SPP1 family phage portal protein